MAESNIVPLRQTPEAEAPPHNLEVEKSLLGALMHDNATMADVAPIVEAGHFFFADHQEIYTAVASLIARGIQANSITVKGYLPKPIISGVPAYEYLVHLSTTATTTGAKGYAEIVRDFATKRELVVIGEDLVEQARHGGLDAGGGAWIESAMADLLVARTAVPDVHLASMSGAEGGAWMLERNRELRAGLIESTAISTGIHDLDNVPGGGFQRGQLWLLAARPGMGKTVAMTSLSRLAARSAGVIVFQCEVTRDQQWARYLADLSYVHNRPITFGQIMSGAALTEEDDWRLEDAQKRLAKLHLRVDCEPSVSVAQITFAVKAEKKRLAAKGLRLGVVFIDYLKFIKVSDRYKGQRVLEIGEITGTLKQLAKAEDICVVLLTQLSRQTEAQGREDRRPTLADLRDSGELEQDADCVLFQPEAPDRAAARRAERAAATGAAAVRQAVEPAGHRRDDRGPGLGPGAGAVAAGVAAADVNSPAHDRGGGS